MRLLILLLGLAVASPTIAGAQWTYVPSGTTAELRGLSVLTGNVVWASAGEAEKGLAVGPAVALTSGGGRTWRTAATSPAAYLSGVAYAGGADHLVAVGLAGTFVSRDSGQTWIQTDMIALNSVRFIGKTGIAVGPRGRIARMGLSP